MSRRDTIIIAVLINVGLLSILFATALNTDHEVASSTRQIAYGLSQSQAPQSHKMVSKKFSPRRKVIPANTTEREKEPEAEVAVVKSSSVEAPKPLSAESEKVRPVSVFTQPITKDYVEVTVKAGDNLDKLAKANGTSISKLRQLNQLDTSTLQIGQVLKVPKTQAVPQPVAKKMPVQADSKFYTVQKGDNPWAIARKHGVSLSELLSLNELDEEKARRLKPGDKLKIR